MSVLVVHDVGTSLKEIIGQCKAKDFDRVFCRCLYTNEEGELEDILIGLCAIHGGEIESLDGDIYDFEEKYVRFEEGDVDGDHILKVWANGTLQANDTLRESS